MIIFYDAKPAEGMTFRGLFSVYGVRDETAAALRSVRVEPWFRGWHHGVDALRLFPCGRLVLPE